MSKHKDTYCRRLQFYETDAMGIIHHANYLKLMEEARLQFLRSVYTHNHGEPEGPLLAQINYPLVHCQVDYKKPMRFNEDLLIHYDVWTEGARLFFSYLFETKSFENPVAFGKTVHVAFDMNTQRAVRLPKDVLDYLQQTGK